MSKTNPCISKVAILGAGPVGIECASALQASLPKTTEIIILEAGDTIASNIRQNWAHVRLFSPWQFNTSASSRRLLESTSNGHVPGRKGEFDAEECVTGGEYIDRYLEPVMNALAKFDNVQVRTRTKVVSIGRSGLLKRDLGKQKRSKSTFNILCTETIPANGQTEHTNREYYLKEVDAVLDCTGTHSRCSWFGEGGIPAIGERALINSKHSASHFTRQIPSVGAVNAKRVAIIGSGYSAATTVRNLLATPSVQQIYWLTRKVLDESGQLYKVFEGDVLKERAALCELANGIVNRHAEANKETCDKKYDKVEHMDNCTITQVDVNDDEDGTGISTVTITIQPTDHTATRLPVSTLEVDYLVSNVGMRPDLTIHSELQVHTCYASEGPMALAVNLMAAAGDCLAQPKPGIDSLLTPEPNFFVLGTKSYGTSSSFLLRVGVEQAEAVARYLCDQI